MKFHNEHARLFVPDGAADALGRVTHLGIGAHQDDLEFMALHGILACYTSDGEWFGGVTCTNGSGSARTGAYESFTGDRMREQRAREQEEAAVIGRYAAIIQLDYTSSEVNGSADAALKSDLVRVLEAARPKVVYTHNPADKHETHVSVVVAALQAMRELPAELRPGAVYGCEVWRGLDWLSDDEKILHDVSAGEALAAALGRVFDSQVSGGKRYDLAVPGRRLANATFFDPHKPDGARMVAYAMDLTPLVADPSMDIVEYVSARIAKFEEDVRGKLIRRIGK